MGQALFSYLLLYNNPKMHWLQALIIVSLMVSVSQECKTGHSGKGLSPQMLFEAVAERLKG